MSNVKPLLVIVDDDVSTLTALERLLRADFEVRTFSNPEMALAQLQNQDPALVLTDSMMPQMNGIEFLKKVRDVCPHSVRVLLSGQMVTHELSVAINQGLIHRFFIKPWENEILKLQLLECMQQRKTLQERDHLVALALTDPVTGLGNHRLFQEQIRIEVERAKRHNRILSILMMDIDHFKAWNDTHGHPAGDLLLKDVARHLLLGLRTIDWVARYGGDEFAVILPDTHPRQAFEISERLRLGFHQILKSDSAAGLLSLSFGIASYPQHGKDAKELILAADRALYSAKKQGRNQSVIASSAD